jgi:hypothetical protein
MVGCDPVALRAGAVSREPDDWDVIHVIRRGRKDEAAKTENTFEQRFMKIGTLNVPPVGPRDHEAFVAKRHDGTHAVRRDELCPSNLTPLFGTHDSTDQVEV